MHIQTAKPSGVLTDGVIVGNAFKLNSSIEAVISEIMDIILRIATSSYVGNMIGRIVQ